MKKTTGILLIIYLILSLITVTAFADSSAQEVVLSENLTLENISYEFSESGSMMISATVTGPSNIAEVRIGSWMDNQPTAEAARQMAEQMISVWKRSQSSISDRDLPFNCYNSRPVDSGDLGKTQYIILVGMDTSVNYVGYAVLKADIPGSTEPDTPSPVAFSENLALENISYEFTENGYMQISATVTGPANIAEVRIGGWMDNQPTAATARQIAEQGISVWQQSQSSLPERNLPFDCYNSRPVSESDLGKTQYIILVGMDTSVNYVGYAVLKADIPGSTEPDIPSPVAFSENLTLEDICYEFTENGYMQISATVTGPANIAEVRIAGWRDNQPTAEAARQMAEQMISVWKQYGSSLPEQNLPFECFNSRPVSEGDLGKTEYIILVGMDTSVDYVGYAVLKADIPESLEPDTPTPDSFSENLTLENVSFEFNDGGLMVINATAIGPSNVVEVRLSGWMDSRPTAASARQMTKDIVSRWKQSQSSFPERDLPFEISNRIYLSAEEYGKTVYLILAGMDTNADYVGYAVYKVDIPEGSGSNTVSFNTNGGSTLEDQVVPKGAQAVRPDNPTKDGYWFGGWFKDESLSILYDFDTVVTEDTVLYAKWITPDFVLPTGLTTIDEAAFSGDAFTFVVLPENIETIASGTFADCPYLSYIYIPAGIQSIHAEAFGDIQNLTILGSYGSPAEVYAQTHGFAFIDVS